MTIKRRVLHLASQIDVEQPLIRAYDRMSGISWGEYNLDEQIRQYELPEEERNGDVLFSLIPATTGRCHRFGVLGHALRTRGYRPIFLYDDDYLPAPLRFKIDDENKELKNIKFRYRVQQFLDTFGFKAIPVSDVVAERNYEEDIKQHSEKKAYRGIPISDCVEASIRGYLKEYSLDFSNPDKKALYNDFFRSALILADASKYIFEEYDVDVTVVSESSYVRGFVPLAVSRDLNVPAYTFSYGYKPDHFIFGRAANRDHMSQFAARGVVETALNEQLTETERQTVENIISGWRNNQITTIDYANRTGESIDPDADTVIGLFTNLLWDGALEPDLALYNNVYNWLEDTIAVLQELDGTHLVIKPHPAEHLRGTNEAVGDWIQAEYDSLPANITLLSPDTGVDTYALFDDLDLGLVYASTVGLEMVYDGIPVITAGYPPYREFKITNDPETKSEYRALLEEPDAHSCEKKRQIRARRYLHFLFCRQHFHFPYHNRSAEDKNSTEKIRHDDLTPRSEPWDTIVQQMVRGDEVYKTD